jgi:hypothetical protein
VIESIGMLAGLEPIFLIHRMLRRAYAKVAAHVWTLSQNGLASGDRPNFDVAVPPLFTPRYYIAASQARRNGRGSGNYAGSAVVPNPNRVGPNNQASSI